jgi:NAD-dependent SIR2 family protein deacetylase
MAHHERMDQLFSQKQLTMQNLKALISCYSQNIDALDQQLENAKKSKHDQFVRQALLVKTIVALISHCSVPDCETCNQARQLIKVL